MCLNKQTSNRPEDVMGNQMILLRYITRHLKKLLQIYLSTLRNSCVIWFFFGYCCEAVPCEQGMFGSSKGPRGGKSEVNSAA